MRVPGIGPIISSTMVAAIGTGDGFQPHAKHAAGFISFSHPARRYARGGYIRLILETAVFSHGQDTKNDRWNDSAFLSHRQRGFLHRPAAPPGITRPSADLSTAQATNQIHV
jgi:hypothetical protein